MTCNRDAIWLLLAVCAREQVLALCLADSILNLRGVAAQRRENLSWWCLHWVFGRVAVAHVQTACG